MKTHNETLRSFFVIFSCVLAPFKESLYPPTSESPYSIGSIEEFFIKVSLAENTAGCDGFRNGIQSGYILVYGFLGNLVILHFNWADIFRIKNFRHCRFSQIPIEHNPTKLFTLLFEAWITGSIASVRGKQLSEEMLRGDFSWHALLPFL